jgi:hypothetical protein
MSKESLFREWERGGNEAADRAFGGPHSTALARFAAEQNKARCWIIFPDGSIEETTLLAYSVWAAEKSFGTLVRFTPEGALLEASKRWRRPAMEQP